MKELKDFLPLYFGCEVLEEGGNNGTLKGIMNQDGWIRCLIDASSGMDYWTNVNNIKPILRPLSDMSDDEVRELIKWDNLNEMYTSVSFSKDKNGINIHYAIDAGDGMVYPQLHNISFLQFSSNEFHYLLSKHFDLFGLIESGLAIDATILNKKDNTIKAE